MVHRAEAAVVERQDVGGRQAPPGLAVGAPLDHPDPVAPPATGHDDRIAPRRESEPAGGDRQRERGPRDPGRVPTGAQAGRPRVDGVAEIATRRSTAVTPPPRTVTLVPLAGRRRSHARPARAPGRAGTSRDRRRGSAPASATSVTRRRLARSTDRRYGQRRAPEHLLVRVRASVGRREVHGRGRPVARRAGPSHRFGGRRVSIAGVRGRAAPGCRGRPGTTSWRRSGRPARPLHGRSSRWSRARSCAPRSPGRRAQPAATRAAPRRSPRGSDRTGWSR